MLPLIDWLVARLPQLQSIGKNNTSRPSCGQTRKEPPGDKKQERRQQQQQRVAEHTSYGVSFGPVMRARITSNRSSSTLRKMLESGCTGRLVANDDTSWLMRTALARPPPPPFDLRAWGLSPRAGGGFISHHERFRISGSVLTYLRGYRGHRCRLGDREHFPNTPLPPQRVADRQEDYDEQTKTQRLHPTCDRSRASRAIIRVRTTGLSG